MSDLALLGTHGIADPNVRNFLDRFIQVWQTKMSGDDSLVSRSEFAGLTADVLAQAIGGTDGSLSQNGGVAQAIETLTYAIRSTLVQQVLEQNVNPKIDALLLETGSRLSEQGAAINTEHKVRIEKDGSLASAINRIWGFIGGSTAVIEDGTLASATPSSAVATKWNSVVSAVTDPNTGNISSAAILTETRTYANSANSTLNAIYSVKASVSAGGQTVVGGFALAATGGAGSAQGPTIDFGVLANKFYIAAPSSGYNPTSEYTTNPEFPFIVITTPTVLNGKTYPPGVYMKRAAIGQAAIGSAEIQDASITNAKIGDASITNAKISGAIFSDNWDGSHGWYIGKDGQAYFSRIAIYGISPQSASVPNNTVVTVPHGAGRYPVITCWSADGNVALSGLDTTNVSFRLDNSSGGTVFFTVV